MPFTLSIIRKLGKAGHTLFASDTFDDTPGNHSRFNAHHFVTASPRHDTPQFIADLKKIIKENQIDLLVPSMEEVFYMARHYDELAALTRCFFSPFETLHRLHHKGLFQTYAAGLGLRVPATIAVTTQAGLADAIQKFPHYLARPSFSRGGTLLLTNTGPRAGDTRLEDCHPSQENPWLVQEFITGKDVCTYSIARNGRLLVHTTYETPVQIDDAYGVQFLAVERPEVVKIISTLVEDMKYEGSISFDFKLTDTGPCLIECNPRVTNGALVTPGEALVPAMTGNPPPTELKITAPGEKAQVGYGMISALMDHKVSLPRTIRDFATISDAYVDRHDLLPALYSFLTYRRFEKLAEKDHVDLLDAMLEDVAWNGAAIQ